MPGINGFEATTGIRALEHGTLERTPIVAITAHAMAGDREQCLEAGCTDYIAKPLSRAGLLAAIRRNLPPPHGTPIADATVDTSAS